MISRRTTQIIAIILVVLMVISLLPMAFISFFN